MLTSSAVVAKRVKSQVEGFPCRSENYLINKFSGNTPAQLGLQPVTVDVARAQASGIASKESIAALGPAPSPTATAGEAAAVIAANLTSTGARPY